MKKRKGEAYAPYPKQAEFHALGKDHRERCLLGANQSGKTYSGAYEVYVHLTGLYPEWWEGRRFNRPTQVWVSGNSNETTRDVPQKMLFGPPGELGLGMLPTSTIGRIINSRGTSGYIDTAKIKHVSGGWSTIRFKSFELGREKFQGATNDVQWLDEECPEDIYVEAYTRLNNGGDIIPGTRHREGGILLLTATPLMGMTEVVEKFYPEPIDKQKALVNMTIHDVLHYSEEQREAIIASYPEHERLARSEGIPALGSGRVFPVSKASVAVPAVEIPNHWFQIIGCDFGWDHPQAFVHCAIDRDSGTFWLINAYKQAEVPVHTHAAAVKDWSSAPIAWPHDGLVHDKGSGLQLASQYRDAGLNMMIEHATHPSGGFGTEAGIQGMLDAMKTGKFKVFEHLSEWFTEFQSYHRKDGQIVKRRDDLMSATRMAWMMQRFATQPVSSFQEAFVEAYDPLSTEEYYQ